MTIFASMAKIAFFSLLTKQCRTVGLFTVMLIMFSANHARAESNEAAAFITTLGNKVITVLQDDGATLGNKEAKLADILEEAVDVPWIGQFVLGKYWRRAQEDERERFLTLYRPFIVKTYAMRFRNYSGEEFSVLQTRRNSDESYTVQGQIIRPQAENVRVDYRVGKNGAGEYKIYDFVVEGVSLLNTQRQEFGSVISRKSLNYLNDRLEARIEKLSKMRMN